MSQKLYVGNLPFSTDEQTLEGLFAQAGPVESVRVMRDQATGRARGFAFVEMASEDGARAAIEQFHDSELGGRRLTVNEARPQVPGGGGGRSRGGFGGGGDFGGGGGRRREPRW
jgi:RNA recognition motif-containing protein